MKTLFLALALLGATLPAAAVDVGVSISVGQPNFYGRIEIGAVPRTHLVYAQPVIIERPARIVSAPVYLRVPPGHAKKWSKHCGAYNACGQQVYFVKDSWYNNVYAPQHRGRGNDHVRGNDFDRGNGKGHGNGKGNGNGKGHGNGKH